MIRIWPRRPHDVQTSTKRRTDDHHSDVTQANDASQPTTLASQSSRSHRYTKGGSLDSRYSSDASKSYPHLVFSQAGGIVIPFVAADSSNNNNCSNNGKRSQQQPPQQQQQQQPQQQQQQLQSPSHKGTSLVKHLSLQINHARVSNNHLHNKDR